MKTSAIFGCLVAALAVMNCDKSVEPSSSKNKVLVFYKPLSTYTYEYLDVDSDAYEHTGTEIKKTLVIKVDSVSGTSKVFATISDSTIITKGTKGIFDTSVSKRTFPVVFSIVDSYSTLDTDLGVLFQNQIFISVLNTEWNFKVDFSGDTLAAYKDGAMMYIKDVGLYSNSLLSFHGPYSHNTYLTLVAFNGHPATVSHLTDSSLYATWVSNPNNVMDNYEKYVFSEVYFNYDKASTKGNERTGIERTGQWYVLGGRLYLSGMERRSVSDVAGGNLLSFEQTSLNLSAKLVKTGDGTLTIEGAKFIRN